MKCLRCGGEMKYVDDKQIQLGQTSWILGDLPNLLAGSMALSVYVCNNCGKVELFLPDGITDDEAYEDGVPMKKCPKCGQMHEYDDPKCPFCKYNYYE